MYTITQYLRCALFGIFSLAPISLDQACAQTEPTQAAPEELTRKTGEGEQCLICGQPIHGGEVVELRYKGRRFYVAKPLLGDMLADPDRYFSKLQARSALFNEDAFATPIATNAWLFFGLYVLVGLVSSALCGYLAISRALPPLPWFFAGLFGNVAAIAVLLTTQQGDLKASPAGIPRGLAKVPTTHNPAPCPNCRYQNHPSVQHCGRCQTSLTTGYESEVARAHKGGA